MPRIPRLLIPDTPTVYHVMSKTALPDFPIQHLEKEFLFNLIRKLSRIYFCDILGVCIMSNHFHLLVRMHPSGTYADNEVTNRFDIYYGGKRKMASNQIPFYRKKWSNLSEFIKEIKQTFSKFYNKQHNRVGYFWNDRFKSVIVENGIALVTCLAYIDLNPIRAGIVNIPEAYRWSSIGYHAQTNNSGHYLSTDFGVMESDPQNPAKRFQWYRKFLYETGAIESKKGASIDKAVLKKEQSRNFTLSRMDRFKYRTRYFSDSRFFGSKDFVFKTYQRFKKFFQSSDTRLPIPVKGLEGIYSLKRLKE